MIGVFGTVSIPPAKLAPHLSAQIHSSRYRYRDRYRSIPNRLARMSS